ncbi:MULTISPECIES: CshA/CshB family fibrillar adhesin-related protein [Streptococcus]|uniref:CshA-like fibrillar surface protein B n=1 Tax=Streptococcus sanguinis TaxID=1305 RepID=A0A2X3VFF9_STRSA|nr:MULTISPECIES: CshA/CshB family fibrillar adhesin-related protein [Streptococcus]EGJ44204.1 CshA family fibrillar surface protein B [Streptococcus sanguinis SK1059]EGQ20317.1 CshA family fibrillar surface protein B [Streptococcus sanguinis ATCC 29667]WNU95711.1 CshA/CshB family fibrillar adhesin-related protein [Streptococcus sp. DTU_2020_1000888_1_SI_GRL_NUU_041A]SQF34529.1 CshA-like fibrillar surface protein B [Streptococcus sanguinis]
MGKDLFNPHLRKFSIRKLNVGVCSVLLSTLLLLGAATQVSADETVSSGTQNEVSQAGIADSSVNTAEPLNSPAEESRPATISDQAEDASAVTTARPDSDGKSTSEQPATETTSAPAVVPAEVKTEDNAQPAPAQPAGTTETAQPSRSRRVRRDAAPTGLRDGDPNNTIEKPTLADSEKKNPTDLMKQINWLDLGDKTAISNLDTDDSFKVGTVYEKEISPGYRIKLTVTELKPFHSTEIYRDRVKGTAYENSYDPNAKNTWFRYVNEDYRKQEAEGDSARPKIIGAEQNQWTAVRDQGINTNGRKTQLQVPKNGASYGIKFKVEATYLGKPVKATVIMSDGEEANPGEYAIFTTNGQGWEHLAEWKRVLPDGSVITDTYAPMNPNRYGQYIGDNATIPVIDWTAFTNPDQKTGGLGSQVFGPNTSKDRTVPLVMTRGASEVGIYIASSGQQAAMIGFMVVDEGDAPASYGNAVHAISGYDANTGARTPQPFLGRVEADIDTTSGNDWMHDDNTDHADEGVNQLLPSDLTGKTNNLFRVNRLQNGDYSVRLQASANGNSKAYVRAWIDFNQNGVFDENEASEFTEVTTAGDYTVNFKNNPAMTNPEVSKLGMRVRIALNKGDIEKPTGTAFSGEVEDLEVILTYPPKGEKKESSGIIGQPQKATLQFTPQGIDQNDESKKAAIDTTVAPVVLDNAGHTLTADGDGWYNTAEGRYKVTAKGANVDVIFEPSTGYIGTTQGINIRRVDTNGASTDWIAKNNGEPVINDKLNNMDARYIPTVLNFTEHRSTDAQGLPQVQDIVFNDGNPAKTPAQPSATNPVSFLDADGNRIAGTSAKATSKGQEVGTFELDPATGRVTFTPNKSFVGTVDPVNLQLHDTDGTEHRATYQPTVTRVVPTAQGANSEGIQGAEQSGNLIFTPGDNRVPINEAVAPTFDNGQTTKVVPNVGTYMVDNAGRVTFQPVPSYTGRPSTESVKRVDMNGTEVTAAYQAEVKAATPTGQDTQTVGLQGQLQTSQLNFTPGQATVNNQTQTVPLNPAGPQFVVDGQVQQGNTLAVSDASGKLQGTYTVQANGDISFQPAPDFYGTPTPAHLRVRDKNGSTADAVYWPNVTQVTPTSTDATSTGPQGVPQTGTPSFQGGDSLVPIDMDSPMTFKDGQSKKSVPGVGVYTINSDGSITFTPEKQYVGTPTPVTVKRVDKNGTEVTATYTPTVTKVTPVGTNATGTGPQGLPQTGTPTFAGGDPLVPIDETVEPTFEDGSKEKNIPGQGTYTITPDGAVTFTPEKQFVGKPYSVTVKRIDKNGTPVTATYSPEFTKVTPTGTNATSTGPQGVSQTGTPTFTGGNPLVPIDETVEPTFEDGSKEKNIPGQGTYTIAPDGAVTFTPEKQFVGKPDPVTVKRVDKNGTPVTATYSPEFTKVTPTGANVTSTGPQGLSQTGTPTFQGGDPLVPIDETVTPSFEDDSKEKKIPGQGTYTIAPDGAVTFTPDKQFVGKPDPITVKRVDKNGTPVTATYSPEFTKVTPTSTNATSTGPQGVPQTGTPTFAGGDPLVPIDETVEPSFEDGAKEKVIPGQGTYTIAPDGAVTFTPEKQFVGKPDSITVKRVDKNGTEVTATYSPEFTKVIPTGKNASSTNIKGHVQTGKPVFKAGDPLVPIDETVEPSFEDGSKEKTIPGQGSYTITPDGTVTFIPEANFLGQGTGVTLVRRDKNGTSVTARYIPTVVEPSTSKDSVSSGRKGQAQTGTPTFEGAIDHAVAPTFADGSTEMVVPGEGTYRFNMLGAVTFVPEADFVGTASGVVVKRIDIYGNAVTATYTPTVLGSTATEDTGSTGLKGKPQTGKPIFEGDVDPTVPPTFEDGSTEKVVPGQGTYTIAPDGTVTFVPEAGFVGQADGVTVIRKDRNGQTISAVYIPTVTENPVQPERTITPAPLSLSKSEGAKSLPKTGTEETSYLAASLLAGVSGLGLLGLAKRKKKSED